MYWGTSKSQVSADNTSLVGRHPSAAFGAGSDRGTGNASKGGS